MEVKNNSVTCSKAYERYIEAEMKECVSISQTGLQNESELHSSHTTMEVKNDAALCSEECEMLERVDIKEEPWSMEITSSETKYRTDAPFVSDFLFKEENKDLKEEGISSASSPRLFFEAISSGDESKSASDLAGNGSLKIRKCNQDGEKNSICDVHGDDITGLFCAEQSDSFIKPDKSPDHNQFGGRISDSSCTQKGRLKARKSYKRNKIHHCDICERSFTQKGHLKTHKLIHEGQKPHKCNACEKSFTQMSSLRKHCLIHQGIKPYKCNICDKHFSERGNLNTHKLIHEGKKPHKCDICDKSFTARGQLKTHKLIHEGKRPHKCDICEKTFIQLGHLKTHKVVHKGKKPRVKVEKAYEDT